MENKKIILGRNPVFEYIKSLDSSGGCELFLLQNVHGKIIDIILKEAQKKGIRPHYKDKNYFHKLSPSSKHQGVALALPGGSEPQPGTDLIEEAAAAGGVLVLLDHIIDPHNTGAIIRTAEALGCRGVLYPKSNSAGITPTVIKASAGATAHIPLQEVSNVASCIDKAKSSGFWVIGTSDQGTHDLTKIQSIRPSLIIIGSEGEGMKRLTKEKCDYIVSIPLKGKISSLNASVAAGIVLYEILK